MKEHFSIANLFATLACLALASCDQISVSPFVDRETAGPAWTEKQWPKFLDDVKTKLGDNPRLLRVNAERHFAAFEAQDPKEPENVDAWQLRNGLLEGPIPVRPIGDGELEPSLFHWNEVALEKIPALCTEALNKLNLEGGEVVGVNISRHFEIGLEVELAMEKSRAELAVVGQLAAQKCAAPRKQNVDPCARRRECLRLSWPPLVRR